MITTGSREPLGRRDRRGAHESISVGLAVIVLTLGAAVLVKSVNLISFRGADIVLPAFASLDPDDVFVYISIHHVIQLALAVTLMLAAIAAVPGIGWSTFGLTTRNARTSLRSVVWFALGWSVIQFGVGFVLVRAGMSAAPGYPLTPRNVLGILAFQLLLSGTSEEILYRGLVMTSLLLVFRRLFAGAGTLEHGPAGPEAFSDQLWHTGF